MAYFPNGSAGEVFAEQCSKCRYGEGYCPIHFVQYNYNYDACNNKVASAILNALVSNCGTCSMFALDPKHFENRRGAEPERDTVRQMLDALGEKA